MSAARREKRPALVIAFPTTAAAMACEDLCETGGLPGRAIPLPGEVAAGCGLAWKAAPEDEETLRSALDAAGIPYERMAVIEMWEVVR